MPLAVIFPASLTIPTRSNQSLSSCRALTDADLFRPISLSSFPVATAYAGVIHMGGGPRTFPGGVSKWQWKRMQAKKAQQLLKARLCRERQLYEMRKRAELKAAISELERPWEVVERAPVLFSVSADEQVKVLADRFQRPTGFDMWSERDGPQLFRSPDDLPSARFFPKGAVHSLKPYHAVTAKIPDGGGGSDQGGEEERYNDWIARGAGGIGRGGRVKSLLPVSSSPENVISDPVESEDGDTRESRHSFSSDLLPLEESRKEEKERHGLNHDHRYDTEIGFTSLRLDEGGMAEEYSGSTSRSQVSYFPNSEHGVTSLKMEGNKRSDSFSGRRGGRRGHGGRNGNRGSYRSNFAPMAGTRMGSDMVADNLDRRQNWVTNGSNSKITAGGSSMNGRGGRGGTLGSYRSYSKSVLNDPILDERNSGTFGRYGRSPESHNRPVADRRIKAGHRDRGGHDCIVKRDSYDIYSDHDSRLKGDAKADRVGRPIGRGNFQGSYGSNSKDLDARSNKGTKMVNDFGRSGRGGGRGLNAGRFLVRTTSQFRLEGGGQGRRGMKLREEE